MSSNTLLVKLYLASNYIFLEIIIDKIRLMGVMESQLMSESIQFYYSVYTYFIHCFQIDQYSENYKKTKHSIYNIHST